MQAGKSLTGTEHQRRNEEKHGGVWRNVEWCRGMRRSVEGCGGVTHRNRASAEAEEDTAAASAARSGVDRDRLTTLPPPSLPVLAPLPVLSRVFRRRRGVRADFRGSPPDLARSRSSVDLLGSMPPTPDPDSAPVVPVSSSSPASSSPPGRSDSPVALEARGSLGMGEGGASRQS